ncbi:MAG: hypothetical protein HOB98_03010 [Gammaproteobacteria bacterium]|jgi:hypothetical protein|nr:hypothetical protein [Gammaproteobacteria bacterium]MBT3866281.1 hypothetical protein [Gammaproteobacteria bacterium]MBT4379295.1 hypothetical protein [Gammaproteobacteria bacterium]MBT4615400.1 hypothetical protein [Gammaproteobacteria bacterium]MBT5198958.1 hypothetical protein [Gammaproteobacteria bacterium]
MLETELSAPVKAYLESHGYQVNCEVKDCDIVATRGDDLIIVELKTSVNLTLLVQATKRQSISDSVYVAVPAPTKRNRQWRGTLTVLKRLEVGLLLVEEGAMGMVVSKQFDPIPYQRKKNTRSRRALLTEVADRSGDYNVGGSTKTTLMTAYRENAILIACCLSKLGPSSPKSLRNLGTGGKTTSILSANHYGWFQRVEKGVYELTDQGDFESRSFKQIYKQAEAYVEAHH